MLPAAHERTSTLCSAVLCSALLCPLPATLTFDPYLLPTHPAPTARTASPLPPPPAFLPALSPFPLQCPAFTTTHTRIHTHTHTVQSPAQPEPRSSCTSPAQPSPAQQSSRLPSVPSNASPSQTHPLRHLSHLSLNLSPPSINRHRVLDIPTTRPRPRRVRSLARQVSCSRQLAQGNLSPRLSDGFTLDNSLCLFFRPGGYACPKSERHLPRLHHRRPSHRCPALKRGRHLSNVPSPKETCSSPAVSLSVPFV